MQGTATKTPVLEDWEAFASSDPQPKGTVLYETEGISVLSYEHPEGEYLVVWAEPGASFSGWYLFITELLWRASEQEPLFIGSAIADGSSIELVWFAYR